MFKKLSEEELCSLRAAVNLYMSDHPTTQLNVAKEMDLMPYTLRKFMKGGSPMHPITVAKVLCFLKSKGYEWHPGTKGI